MPFARYKGEAEKALLAAGFSRLYLFRPAYIYPVEPRKEPNFSYRLLRAIYPAFRSLFPNQVIRADDLARGMVDVALPHQRFRAQQPPPDGVVEALPSIRGKLGPDSINPGKRSHGRSLVLPQI